MSRRVYSEHKASGVKWLGEIPKHWEMKRIKHTTYVKGRIGWHGLKSDEFIDEGPYLVTGTDFINGEVNWATCYHVSEERYKEDPYIQLKEKDLLITKDGTIGKTALVRNLPDKASLNSGVFVTRPTTSDYMTKFLYWVLNSNVFNGFIDCTKTGTTISHLYQNVFVDFTFPIPTLNEQRTIAVFLDHETKRIDTLIEKKQRQSELLQEKRDAVISHAVTKGLYPNVKMRDSGIEWLGEIPEHWDTHECKFGFAIQLGKMLQNEPQTVNDEQVPYLKALHVQWESIDISDFPKMWASAEDIRKYSVRNGDLLVCEGGEVGRAGILQNPPAKCIIQNALHRVRPKGGNCNQFLLYLIEIASYRGWFNMLCNKATIAHFTGEKFGQLSITLPPPHEQRTIAAFLDCETARIDALIGKVRKSINLLCEYRTALISAAVTGKIDVRKEVA